MGTPALLKGRGDLDTCKQNGILLFAAQRSLIKVRAYGLVRKKVCQLSFQCNRLVQTPGQFMCLTQILPLGKSSTLEVSIIKYT